MPVEKAYPIKDVIALLREYDFSHQRRLSFEYIMFKGINDDRRHCQELARLLKDLDCRVNLIRYHALPASDRTSGSSSTAATPSLLPPSTEVMERFRDSLNAAGITATIRASRGEDIMAACGMLAGKNRQESAS